VRKLSLTLLALATMSAAARNAHAQGDVGGPVSTDSRPGAPTVGIGFGVQEPGAATLAPNVGSVRIVLAPNLILEPSVSIRHSGSTHDAMGTATDHDKTNAVELGTDVRFVLASRGPVDFAGIGGLGFSYQTIDKGGNVDESTTAIDLHWGFGLSWYFARVWSLSFDALNPQLLGWKKVTTTANIAGMTTTTSDSTLGYGLSYIPTVRFMLHLFF
jgi:hypothetical protein